LSLGGDGLYLAKFEAPPKGTAPERPHVQSMSIGESAVAVRMAFGEVPPPPRNWRSTVSARDNIAIKRRVVTKQLIVRNVDDGLVRALKRRATRHGRSAEAEHREILRDALRADLERSSFKQALATMPDVGADEDFVVVRDLPRDVL